MRAVIMLVMGAIFLIVGAGMLAFGFLRPGGGGGLEELLGLGITGFVFVVIGVIFIPIGVFMVRGHARDDRIRREGIPGSATITDIGETNMTINDRPVLNLSLQVTVPGRSPYVVQKRITMPWNALGRIAVGATVPVKVDRTDPEDIVIDWTGAPAFGIAMAPPQVTTQAAFSSGVPGAPGVLVPNQLSGGSAPMPPGQFTMTGSQVPAPGGEALLQYLRSMGVDVSGPIASIISAAASNQQAMPMALPPSTPPALGQALTGTTVPPPLPAGPASLDVRADEGELRRSGLAGRATIRGAEDLGVGGEGKRLVRLELEVTPTGRAAFPLQHVTMVPESSMPRLAPGTSLAVHVDAANPQNLAIDWDGA